MAKALAAALVYVVVQEFRDKDDFDKTYKVGQEVNFEEQRLVTLLGLGLIKQKQADAPDLEAGKKAETKSGSKQQSSKKAGEGKAEPTTPADNIGTGEEANGTGGSDPLLD